MKKKEIIVINNSEREDNKIKINKESNGDNNLPSL
jgi:hypothetical protein